MDNFNEWLKSKIDEAECNKICAASEKEEEYWNGYIDAMSGVLEEWNLVMKDGNE